MNTARRLLPLLGTAVGLLVGAWSADAQQKPPPATPPATPAPPALPGAAPAAAPAGPLQPADIANHAEITRRMLDEITTRLSPSLVIQRIDSQLPDQERLLEEFSRLTQQMLGEPPHAGLLWQLTAFWSYQINRLDGLLAVLNDRADIVAEEQRRLDDANKQWRATLQTLDTAGSPADLRARVRGIIANVAQVIEVARQQENEVLTLQSRVLHQHAIADEVLKNVDASRELFREEMMRQDGPLLWKSWPAPSEFRRLSSQIGAAHRQAFGMLRKFATTQAQALSMRLALFLVIWFVARRFGRRVREWIPEEPELSAVTPFFRRPMALALFVTLASLVPLFPTAPRVFEAPVYLLTYAALLRLILPVTTPHWRRFLIVPAPLLLADRLRFQLEAAPPLERYALVLEVLLAIGGIAWLIRQGRRSALEEPVWATRPVLFLLHAALLGLVGALIASVLGYSLLAGVLGQGIVQSFFVGILLFGAVRMLRILFRASLLTNNNRAILLPPSIEEAAYRWVSVLLGVGALAIWAVLTLDLFVVRDLVMGWLALTLTTPIQVRGFGMSMGDVLSFFAVVVAAFATANVIRTILQDGVLPVLSLQRGLPHTIATLSYYAVLWIGFLFAAAASGADLNRFTLLASAFTVGLGFGMQQVVNNFVSGLILLFERPIQIGDTLEMGPLIGRVLRIGLRSVSLQTPQGAEVIVPNGTLVTTQIINWTRSDVNRRVDLPISVAPGPEPEKVAALLCSVALDHPDTLHHPAPLVLIKKLGKASFDFELQLWARQENVPAIQSGMLLAISEALQTAEIAMA